MGLQYTTGRCTAAARKPIITSAGAASLSFVIYTQRMAFVKRTLMLKNRGLLDFEFEPATRQVSILDAPEADDPLLASLGFGGSNRQTVVARMIAERRMAANRDDMPQILDAFGVSSNIELVLRGHGLSLIDQLWYRKPGSTERWEDINFFDNEWDTSFDAAILMRDYRRIASCSLETPDVTTRGHMGKTWERTPNGIHMVKEPIFENGCVSRLSSVRL